jgi:hypothetical protein
VLKFARAFTIAMLFTGCANPAASLPSGVSAAAWSRATIGDVLFISDGSGYVYVYEYPSLTYVTKYAVLDSPSGLCADQVGHVFVPQNAEYFKSGWILELARGYVRPIRMIPDPGAQPLDCAVDPTTQNLAVTSYSGLGPGEPGSVAIFAGFMRVYTDPDLFFYGFCTYDPTGDLFVDGQDVNLNPVLAELPKDGNALVTLNVQGLPPSFGYPAGLAWSGDSLLLGDLDHDVIYELRLSGTGATVTGSIKLRGGHGVEQFTIFDRGGHATLIGPNSFDTSVGLWPYPRGGKPSRTITGIGAFGSVITKGSPRRSRTRGPR